MSPSSRELVVLERWVAALWAKTSPRRRWELAASIRRGAGDMKLAQAAVATEALAIVEALMRAGD
jgi:hypothetical protein